MNPHELLTLREVAAVTGVRLRTIRQWADTGQLDTIQVGPHTMRLVPARELYRLENAGFFLDWTAIPAIPANPVSDDVSGIR